MSEDAKKALTTEVVAVKTRWASEIKLQKAPKDAPKAPLPLCVARTIARPDNPVASAYDVDELTIKMWIDGLEIGAPAPPAAVDISDAAASSSAAPAAAPPADGLPVRVEVADGNVPKVLQDKIAAKVRDRWAAELRARGSSQSWFLEKLLAWAEGAFIELLTLDPSLVETYEGVNEEGMTIRRFAIAEPPPPPPPKPEGADSDDDDDSDEDYSSSDDEAPVDDIDARLKKMGLDPDKERQMRIKMKAEEEEARRYKEQRRKEAEEARQRGDEPLKRTGKKEQEEARKQKEAKKGARLRKAGAKHNKFDAEAAGKTKNKKNGLIH